MKTDNSGINDEILLKEALINSLIDKTYTLVAKIMKKKGLSGVFDVMHELLEQEVEKYKEGNNKESDNFQFTQYYNIVMTKVIKIMVKNSTIEKSASHLLTFANQCVDICKKNTIPLNTSDIYSVFDADQTTLSIWIYLLDSVSHEPEKLEPLINDDVQEYFDNEFDNEFSDNKFSNNLIDLNSYHKWVYLYYFNRAVKLQILCNDYPADLQKLYNYYTPKLGDKLKIAYFEPFLYEAKNDDHLHPAIISVLKKIHTDLPNELKKLFKELLIEGLKIIIQTNNITTDILNNLDKDLNIYLNSNQDFKGPEKFVASFSPNSNSINIYYEIANIKLLTKLSAEKESPDYPKLKAEYIYNLIGVLGHELTHATLYGLSYNGLPYEPGDEKTQTLVESIVSQIMKTKDLKIKAFDYLYQYEEKKELSQVEYIACQHEAFIKQIIARHFAMGQEYEIFDEITKNIPEATEFFIQIFSPQLAKKYASLALKHPEELISRNDAISEAVKEGNKANIVAEDYKDTNAPVELGVELELTGDHAYMASH